MYITYIYSRLRQLLISSRRDGLYYKIVLIMRGDIKFATELSHVGEFDIKI